MRLHQFISIVYLAQFASAWPWPPSIGDGSKAIDVAAMLRRQNSDSSSGTNSGNQKTSQDTATATDSNTASITNSGQGTSTPTGTRTVSGGGSGKNSTKTTSIDDRNPAGGVSMMTPNPTLGPQYYKIGDWVTFAWNYTSLSVTPSAINVVASCSQNQQTYTLTANASVAPTGTILWDTKSYQNTARIPLLTNIYTLIIYDANRSITATPQPGYLGSYNQFTFGMYQPQPYQNWTDFQCPTCNGAASLKRMTLHFLLGTVGITVLTFTWFVTNLSAF